ncbi:MAG: type II toxin-antitoxin system mRNA interferase toxin, RelE/StbE family [Planctomycetia bacterium]|nr:type II toxin-antitoxin system mRNA interferase toxin, RelE/StbE family [Planctomycetia bacterium]
MYRVIFVRKAVKELKKIDAIWQRRIKERIELLAENPAVLKPNIKKLKGRYNKFARLRVGNYRIIFKIIEKELVILIIRIAHRKEAY